MKNCLVCFTEITSGRSDKKYCSDKCGAKYRNRKYDLKRYNISPEYYFELMSKCNGMCSICGKKDERAFLSVDHDRKCCPSKKSCGKCIRGLLCWRCNAALGGFYDDINLLRSALKYLEDYNEFACLD